MVILWLDIMIYQLSTVNVMSMVFTGGDSIDKFVPSYCSPSVILCVILRVILFWGQIVPFSITLVILIATIYCQKLNPVTTALYFFLP